MNAPLPAATRQLAFSARRVAIGTSVVDLATHEVFVDDAPRIRLTPKAIGVLRVLIDHEGAPVHRDALIERVWPNQFPTDDVVTKAVRELRRALGETETHPVITTLPRVGYLLKLPVIPLPDPREPAGSGEGAAAAAAGLQLSEIATTSAAEAAVAAPQAPSTRPSPAPGRRWLLPLAAALALAAGGVVLTRPWQPAPSLPAPSLPAPDLPATTAPARASFSAPGTGSLAPRLEVMPFTADPGDEGAPDVSDDGKLVAYISRRRDSSNYRIYIRSIDGLSERRLTQSTADEDELQPVFAPDGHQLAFQRINARGECSLQLIDLNGGSPHQVSDCASGFLMPIEFSRDGKFLLLPRIGRFNTNQMGFQQLDLGNGELSDYPYPAPTLDADVEGRFSPDGRQLLIRRGSAPNSSLLLYQVGSNQPPRVLPGISGLIRGVTWLSDNHNLVMATDASGVMELWRLDTRNGLTERFGGVQAYFPAAASKAPVLVAQQILRPSALLAVTLDGKADASRSALFVSTRAESWPAFAPDGTRLAFVSDRSGSSQIYLGTLASGEVNQASQLQSGNPFALSFSPDGHSVAFSLRQIEGAAVGILDLRTRRTRLLELGLQDPGRLHYAPDGSLLLDAQTTKGRRLFRLASPDSQAEELPSDCGGRLARAADNGQVFFLSPDFQGLQVLEPGSRKCREVSGSIRWQTMDNWVLHQNQPIAALMNGDAPGLFRIDPRNGNSTLIEPLSLEWTSASGITLSPDGKQAVVTAPIDEQGDLLLVR